MEPKSTADYERFDSGELTVWLHRELLGNDGEHTAFNFHLGLPGWCQLKVMPPEQSPP